MKSKVAGILLIFCLLAPVLAAFTWLHYKKAVVRKEVKWRMIAGLAKEELVLLKFTEAARAELRWKHAREFEYNQQMYDIVETQVSGDTTYYWCWWDYEETRLNIRLNNLVAQALGKDPQNKENQKRLVTFYKSLYHSKTVCWQPNLFLLPQPEQEACHSPFGCLTLTSPPPVPPPEVG